MKNPIQTIITMAAVTLLFGCSASKKIVKTNPCEGMMCTDQFVSVNLQLVDKDGLPIRLDEAYITRISTGEVLRYERTGRAEGRYILVDDSYLKMLKNSSDQFQFTGKKNGAAVVQERYTLEADCCHVSMKEGRDKIVMEQPR